MFLCLYGPNCFFNLLKKQRQYYSLSIYPRVRHKEVAGRILVDNPKVAHIDKDLIVAMN